MPHPLLPTPERPERRYSLPSFIEKAQHPPPAIVYPPGSSLRHNDPETTASLLDARFNSVELCKHHSLLEWRHEFAVLKITYQKQDYLIHIHRSWAAPEGWRQYVPSITWGSQKPSEDEVAIYLPGKEESKARRDTSVVAGFDLSDTVLLVAVLNLAGLWLRNPKYSLIGANCWAFSGCFAWLTLYEEGHSVTNGTILGRSGPVSRDELLAFLSEGNPWAFLPIANLPERPEGIYGQLLRKMDLILEAALRGSGVYRHLRGAPSVVEFIFSSRKGTVYRRRKTVLVSSSGITSDDTMGAPDSRNEIPHSFGHTGIAYDLPAAPQTNLCPTNDFLYLLTPPIILLEESTIPRFVILITTFRPEQESRINNNGESDSWLEYGIVRRNNPKGDLGIVCRRKLTLSQEFGWYTFVGLLEEFKPSDMMGIWVCRPSIGSASWQRGIVIASAYVGLAIGGDLPGSCSHIAAGRPEILGALQLVSPRDLPAGPISSVALSLRHAWRFNWRKLQFRPLSPASGTSGEGSCISAFSDSPNSHKTVGGSNTTIHSTTPYEPGDFLYLLTPQVHLAQKHKVLSVSVYAWNLEGSVDEKVHSSQHSFEVGVVRPTTAGGLQLFGMRHKIPRHVGFAVMNTWLLKKCTHRMDHNHSLVASLKNGDMIGVWVCLKENSFACSVMRVVIAVETGSEGGLTYPSMRSVYGQVIVGVGISPWVRAVGATAWVIGLLAFCWVHKRP